MVYKGDLLDFDAHIMGQDLPRSRQTSPQYWVTIGPFAPTGGAKKSDFFPPIL
jgi:hypothetical protein